MKWLILSDENYLRGGLQTRSREIATVAIEHGDKVQFVCFKKNPFQQLANRFPEQCHVINASPLATRSLRLGALRDAWKILKQANPDILFFCTTGMPNFFPFLFLARWAGIQHRIVHFGTVVARPENGLGLKSYWGREMIVSARLAYNSMTLALFNNTPQMEDWREAYGFAARRSQLWNCPIDLSRFYPCAASRAETRAKLGLNENDFVIGGVGRLDKQKSFDLAILALSEVIRNIPTARLVIVGEGDRDLLLNLATEMGVRDRLLLLGERDDVPQVMNGFDIFCMPSTHPNETLGIVFVEAQACGVPIVAPDLPGPRRVACDGECGILVEPGNPTALAEAWFDLYINNARRDKLIQAGLRNVTGFERSRVFHWLASQMGRDVSPIQERQQAIMSR